MPHDYYATPAGSELLRNVENYHMGPARKKMADKSYNYAQGDIDFMLRYFPNHPRALALMGEVATQTKRPFLARKYFDRAIELYPERGGTYIVYGVFLHKAGDVQDAIKQYRTGLKLSPGDMDGHYNLGLALVQAGQYKEANRHAQKAYALGHPLRGLRAKLERANAWKPEKGKSGGEAPADSEGAAKAQTAG